MTAPLMVLAVLSIVAGYLGIPAFLEPVFHGEGAGAHHEGSAALVIMALATLMGLTGIGTAYYLYVLNPGLPDRLAQQWRAAYELSLHKWYIDEAGHDRLLRPPCCRVAQGLWKHVDVAIIDGAVNGVARAIAWGGWLIRLTQSGQTQHYWLLGMTLGAVVILTVYLLL